MAMTVVPNPDGSYTVECGGVKVTVGGSQAPGAAPGRGSTDPIDPLDPIEPVVPAPTWPRKPRPNRGGVVAHLHVGGAPLIQLQPFGFPDIEVPPAGLMEAAPGARIVTRPLADGTLQVDLHAPPGTPLRMDLLQEAVLRLRQEYRSVELHIHVALNDGAPQHDQVQVGLS